MAKSRPEILGEYILKNKCTIRQTAKVFSIGKSTVHINVSKKLKNVNLQLYLKVKKILDYNYSQRNIRGGEATKLKYLQLKQRVN